ncbi:MAG: aminotransferase class I/II-fold pyridoxal phosphate-dependent enzyme [Gemmatimonadota bacterium]
MPPFSSRFGRLPAYPLAHIPAAKRALVERGVDVIDLGAGDADLAPPPAAVEALQQAAATPALGRYGFGPGHVPFREAISEWMQLRFGLSFDPMAEIVPLIGSKEGLAHIAFAYSGPDDVAIIPEPAYQAYLGGTLLAGARPHIVPLRPENRFLVPVEQLPREIVEKTRLIYLNYPNNPTTAVAPIAYLERVVDFCQRHDVLLVYDNAYSELAFDGYRPPSIFEIDGAREVAIEFHSLSKTYNMTGWRCGWAVASPPVATALARLKTFLDTGTYMGIQAAGAAALRSWSSFVPGNVEVFRERRDAAVAAFRSAGFECESPRATMYLWVPLPDGVSSAEFADRLMNEEGVIALPGAGFGEGGEGFFRVSFIVSPDRLREAAQRAGRLLGRMTPHAAVGS